MPKFIVHTETRIVKQATVVIDDARDVADALEQAKLRLKAGDVDWGNAEVDQQTVDVVEIREEVRA
jgi:hypothetical protein